MSISHGLKRTLLCLLTLAPIAAGSALAQTADAEDPTLMEQFQGELAGTLNILVDGQPTAISYVEGDDDLALYQGDIVIGEVAALEAVSDQASLQELGPELLFGLVRRDQDTRWPDGRVRYYVNRDLRDPGRVYSAIAEWESKTEIRFLEIERLDGNYVEFAPGNGCYSSIGMRGGRQVVGLGDGCSIGNVIHEIGHALGLHHEQARSDRNGRIVVYTDNILPNARRNFEQDPVEFEDVGSYCYGSITHYGSYAFSKQPGVLKTIETVPAGIEIGQRRALDACDIETINAIYGFAPADQEPVFTGELELIPEGCERQGKCFLKNDIAFTDQSNVMWMAGKWQEGQSEGVETGTTDGASIPAWAQPIIGEPFDDEYLLAAVLHDHYCYKENYVRTWRQTHRMFYNALRALGVPAVKAKIMYAAVYLGGPKWQTLVPGEHCGPNCIYDAIGDNKNFLKREDNYVYVRDDQYGSERFESGLLALSELISGDEYISLGQIENAIHALRPDDHFYLTPDVNLVTSSDDAVFDL